MHLSNHHSVKAVFACGFLFIVIFENAFVYSQPQAIQTKKFEGFQTLCNVFGKTLIDESRKLAATYELQKIYRDRSFLWTKVKLNPKNILNEAITKIQKILSSAEDAVKILAEEAEKLNKNSIQLEKTNVISLTSEKVRFYDKKPGQISASPKKVYDHPNATLFYYNSKCVCGYQLPEDLSNNKSICYVPTKGFQTHKLFDGKKVSFAFSAVHIPVDVYNAGPSVLRDIVWTQNLESTFKSLFCKNDLKPPLFKWSYVSTLNGVLRYFPSAPWSVSCGKVDLYDARSTHWFVQSMTSPKEVVIMIDTSGSVIGLTLNLIRVSVEHVMNSLTVNDFFNVIVFNKEASFLNSNCPGLLPANYFNKEMVVDWLEKIKVENSSSFENGFNFAFEVLSQKNSNLSYARAFCNPVILLFTDGGVSYPYDALKRWNENQNTRIFTYSVGKHFSSTDELKKIACNNEGLFASIPSDSATHFETMKYLVTMSKPLALFGNKTSKWTLPYEDHLGLNTILTVSRPFFDTYSFSTGNTDHEGKIQVAGVAGVDVLYSDVQKALDTSQWGAATYIFVTDNNGYLFYHPRLRKGRLDSPVVVDVADVEPSNVTGLRRNMIDRQVGCRSLEKLVLSKDGLHLTNSKYSYYYTYLNQSIFSIAFTFPLTDRYRVQPSNNDAATPWGQIVIPDPDVFSAAYGFKCKESFKSSSVCSEPEVIAEDDRPSLCSVLQLKNAEEVENALKTFELDDPNQPLELRLHGQITRELVGHWPTSPEKGLLASFVATDSSPFLLRVKSYEDEYLQEIKKALSDPSSKDYFLRPLLTDDANQSYVSLIDLSISPLASVEQQSTTVFDTNTGTYRYTKATSNPMKINEKHVIVSGMVSVEGNVRPAVSGVVLRRSHVREMLFNKTRDERLHDGDPSDYNCNETDRLCVLLDDGGLLLVTNQNNKDDIGKFFGRVDGELMKSLIDSGLYCNHSVYDHQVVCESHESDGNSATSSFFTPTLVQVINSGWWITSSLLFALQSFLSILLTSINSALTEAASINIPFSIDESRYPNTNAKKVHCIVQSKVFRFGFRNFTVNTTIEGNRSYVASRVPNTNTIFVIASLNESVSSITYPPGGSRKVVTNERKCPSARYRRKPPEKCFNVSYEKAVLGYSGNTECGASQLSSSVPLLLLPIMLFITCLIR